MSRQSRKERGARKHKKAIRRKKKLNARARTPARPAPPSMVVLPRALPQGHASQVRRKAWTLWDPGRDWHPPRHQPVLKTVPGPGPALFGIPMPHDRRIALYPRREDGEAGPVPLEQIPINQQLTWTDEPPVWRDARASEVCWLNGPRLDGDTVRGDVVVHFLVDTEEGTVWSPVVPIELTRQGEAWELDAGGVGAGRLERDAVEWEWGAEDTHVNALCTFLDEQVELLWRVLGGGPGLDAAWRVRALRGPSPVYKRWAIDDVMALGEQAVPPLLAILDGVLDGDSANQSPDDCGPLYALTLLAHIGSRDAHDRFLSLARMERDRFERWFGGYLTERFDAALLRTSHGDVGGMLDLVQDRHCDGYLRSSAVGALLGAVALGQADRDEVLAVLAAQLEPGASVDPNSYIWCGVGGAILDLHGVDYLDQLVEACECGLIEPMHFDANYVRQQMGSDREPHEPACLELLHTRNVHQWIGWWASFDDQR